ncbi:cilia- and flagella-associated protein 157 [Discoglossus pictus]
MAPKKKKDKDNGKKKKPEGEPVTGKVEALSEQSKEYYVLQIRDLEGRLERYQHKWDEICAKESLYSTQFEQLSTDKKEIVSFLKRTLNQRVDENADLSDQLVGLQQAKDAEKDAYEAQLAQVRHEFQETKEQLTSENMLLAGKLASLEEFRVQKEELMAKFAALEEKLRKQEEENKEMIYTLEKKAVLDKDRLKKEMVQRVNSVAAEFRKVSNNQMAETTKRAIRENVSISSQLAKMSDKTMELIQENDHLKDKVADQRKQLEMLEENEREMVKNNLSNQKVIRMLTEKCRQQQEMLELSLQSEEELGRLQTEHKNLQDEAQSLKHRLSSMEEEVQRTTQEIQSVRGQLEEERKKRSCVETVLSQAAASLKDVLTDTPHDEDDGLDVTFFARRSQMLQKLLLLLNSAATLGVGPTLQDFHTKETPLTEQTTGSPRTRPPLSPLLKGPGVPCHYRMGDLGLVPRQDPTNTVVSKMGMLSKSTRLGPVRGNPTAPKDLLTMSYEEKLIKQSALPGIPPSSGNKPLLTA